MSKDQIKAKCAAQTTANLKIMAEKLNSDFSDGAMAVNHFVMDELLRRMDEKEFIAFCENLEETMQ